MEESPPSAGGQQEGTESSDPENTRTKKVNLSPSCGWCHILASGAQLPESVMPVSGCVGCEQVSTCAAADGLSAPGGMGLWRALDVFTAEIFSPMSGLRLPLQQLGCAAKRKHAQKRLRLQSQAPKIGRSLVGQDTSTQAGVLVQKAQTDPEINKTYC